MAAVRVPKHVVITGPPGIGKTSVIKGVVIKTLLLKETPIAGFYTEETKDLSSGIRTGFQVVDINTGEAESLASVYSQSSYRVGQYGVDVEEFESFVLPLIAKMKRESKNLVAIIIDEVGKMELFSKAFATAVEELFEIPHVRIIATIPISKGQPIPFVENIRNRSDAKLFVIDKTNRDLVVDDIVRTIDTKLDQS